MGKILLDYVFPISTIVPTAQASTALLKQVCVVAKPKSGQEGNVGTLYECVSMTEVAARTDNTDAQQLFDAGMSKVYILLMDELNLAEAMTTYRNMFFTVLVASEFTDADVIATKATLVDGGLTFTAKVAGTGGNDITITITGGATAGNEVVTVVDKDIEIQIESGVSTNTQIKAKVDASEDAMELIEAVTVAGGAGGTAQTTAAEANLAGGDGLELGVFAGVVGVSSEDKDFLADQAAIENRCAFLRDDANGAKNLFYAFGKLLSSSNWTNQQLIPMPADDGVDELGEAEALFEDKVSFVLGDDEFGDRLGLFCAGGKAIVAPYILKNLRIDIQSRAVQWISANQPDFTVKEASLLEIRLQEDVVNTYINPPRKWIRAGVVSITLVDDNFTATGAIDVAEPKALWRVPTEMRQTL